ncbi:MAG TPA: helix-hairpin-helix domain-containing protein [Candidatus Omnitrophota bacterium]|nr:helix-hairpin-helix domain-containing protein [Candidatus Omnitrophota bacterium]
MIARIKGRIVEQQDHALLLDVNGITYRVLVPSASLQRISDQAQADNTVELVTFHYHQVEPSRSIPVLIGFLNDVEKEFFEAFITVSGIGPRAAVKALNKPFSAIARAIDEGDAAFLKSLPGIGAQRAKEIIAKLQNRVGRFGLIQDASAVAPGRTETSFEQESLAVLLQLGYKKPEALSMISKAMEANPSISSTEGLLNEVYRQRKTAG